MKKELKGHIWPIDLMKTIAISGVLIQHCVESINHEGWLWNLLIVNAMTVFFLLIGINYAMAAERRGIQTICGYFRGMLLHNLGRILWPWMLAFGLEVGYHSLLRPRLEWMRHYKKTIEDHFRVREMARMMPAGGLGPGAYFIPLMLVTLLVFPFLLRLAKVSWWGGAVLVIAGYWFWPFSQGTPGRVGYAILYVYAGILIWKFSARIPLWASALALGVGIAGYRFWSTRGFELLLTAAIVQLAIQLLPWQPKNLLTGAVSFCAKASFDIYLMQKVYFSTGFPRYLTIEYGVGEWGQFAIALAAGLLFFVLETQLRRALTYIWQLCQRKPAYA